MFMPRQSTTHQFDLFPNPQVMTPPMPRWQALPEGARQALTRLMARLILEHADGDRAVQREGADHDA
jgi:hypothetical protein